MKILLVYSFRHIIFQIMWNLSIPGSKLDYFHEYYYDLKDNLNKYYDYYLGPEIECMYVGCQFKVDKSNH